jgi:bifunctional DNA-binding transcriptional regulator/antitoxin component of YhaV-PrlF toxin-antitoxin module
MSKATISSKGQVTIPVAFRKALLPTRNRQVSIEQLPDGTVQIRPIRSILELAGCLQTKRPLLSVREERRAAARAIAESVMRRGRP